MKQVFLLTILILSFCLMAFPQTNENPCRSIKLTDEGNPNVNQVATYKVEIGKDIEKYNFKYLWSVEGGKLLAGQGTSTVAIRRETVDFGNISVQLRGSPNDCDYLLEQTFSSIDPPQSTLFTEYEKIPEGEKKQIIDTLFIELQNNQNARGIIKFPEGKDLLNQIKFFNYYMTLRKFDKTRILFEIAKMNEKQTQIWIVPQGAEIEDCKDCLIFKAEDFEKLKKLFQQNRK